MSELILFDVQRCSFVDGPGIRTVLFFKGCNLRCQWCHNPESWTQPAQLAYFQNRCVKCGACLSACPAGAVKADFFPDPERCLRCGMCVKACPASARKLYGQRVTAEEAARQALADKPFYATSGGGVTCSGGECMLQLDGLCELLDRLGAEGVQRAVDTAGNVPWESFERVLPKAELFLYDIKAVTEELHRQLTGVPNQLILDNYRRLHAAAPEKLMVRVPVIPGLNDVPGEMEKIAAFLAQYPPVSVELLPCHLLGESKGEALQMNLTKLEAAENDRMEALKAIFRNHGLQIIN